MASLSEHPTVKRSREKADSAVRTGTPTLHAGWSGRLGREAGAHDVGFVDINRLEVPDERADIVRSFPPTKALISFVLRMNREPIRNTARSVANVEFHHTGERIDEVAHH